MNRFVVPLSLMMGFALAGSVGASEFLLDPAPQHSTSQSVSFSKAAPTPGIPLREPDMDWVNATLASMTIEEKIGQLLMTAPGASELTYINTYKIGGFIFLGNNQSAAAIVNKVNTLQGESEIPLWFSIDSEAGLGARVADATVFPMQMAFGAANDPALMEAMGRVTARESQALGIQISFGPVVDVNTEPINPIISSRALGDTPTLVSTLAAGYITGARAEGILCTYKHFPGHGPTQGDSHSSLPGVALTMDQLRAFHIKPYQDLVSGGNVDFVMTAHVWYSSVMGPTPYPSTLSPIFNKTILREEFGYNGLLISDAYNMSGLVLAVPDEKERAVRGIEAGLDVILHTGDISLFHQGILEAVQSNRLTVERIEESVVRILKAKSRAGLPERATVDPGLWTSVLQHPEHQALVRTISEEAITAFRPLGNGAPLQPGDSMIVFNLANNRSIFYNFNTSTFKSELLERYPGCTVVEVAKTPSNTSITGYMNQVMIGNYDKVLVVSTDFEKLRDAQQELLVDSLCTLSPPVVYVSLGSPYHIKQVPNVDAFYCGYTTVPAMQEVAVEALVGERLAPGIPPVNLPEFHSRVYDQLLFW